MSKEKIPTTERMPITVCPDCIKDGFQIDPHQKTSHYPVIETYCRTHSIIQEITNTIFRKNQGL